MSNPQLKKALRAYGNMTPDEVEAFWVNITEANGNDDALLDIGPVAKMMAVKTIGILQLLSAIFFERTKLDQIVDGIHLVTFGYSEPDLQDFLADKAGKLMEQLTNCIMAFDDAGLSLSAGEPRIISNTEFHVHAIQSYLQTNDRSMLRQAAWQRSDDLGTMAKTLFTQQGSLRREREVSSAQEWIGDQLLTLTANRPATKAVEILRDELEMERHSGTLSRTKQEAFYILENWLALKPNTFSQTASRCIKHAAKRHANQKMSP